MSIFLRTIALFWKYWRRALITYFCLFAGAGFTLLIPRLTGDAIDFALGSYQSIMVILMAVAIAGAGILRSIFSYWQSYLSEYLSQRVAYDLRNKIYNHIQHLSYAFHDQSQTGQLISRATIDIEAVRMFVGFAMLRGVYFIVLMITIIVLLLFLDWKLALISLSTLPFISYRTIVINNRLKVLWGRVQQGIGNLGNILQENLSGIRIVRAFARERHESHKFEKQAKELYDNEITINNLFAANSPVMNFALVISMAAVIWYGGREVIQGTLTHGQLVQFLLYLVLLSMPIRMLGWLTMLFSRAMVSGKRIFEIIDQESPVQDMPGSLTIPLVKGKVVFENVGFGYKNGPNFLNNISFTAKPGQVIALVGASGSGKTTLANLIPRFYDASAGNIKIDDIDIREISLTSLRKHIGVVHQDTFLFSNTIRENISYGKPDAPLEEIISAAKIARLHDFISGLPQGYETLIGERGITLSGGQKQRLAIARTILVNPSIVIMDDSTASVDNATEYEMQQSLKEFLKGRTTFIIAHRLKSVQNADMILVLKNGEIAERGTHAELLDRNGLYKELYGLQFQTQQHETVSAEHLSALIESSVPPHISAESEQNILPDRGILAISDEIVYGKPYDVRIISRLLGYFKSHKYLVVVTALATLLFTLSSLAGPYLIGLAENRYILNKDASGLNYIVMIFIGVGLLNWLAYRSQIRTEARLGQSILLKLRMQLFDHLQKLSLRFFNQNEVGRIMSRVQNDVNELNEFLESGAFWVIGEVFTMLGIMIILLQMEWQLGLLALSLVPPLVLFLLFWQKYARRAFIKVRQTVSQVNSALEENISGIRVIQSLSREDLNSKQFDLINRTNFEASLKSARISAVMMPAVELLLSLATAGIIIYGGLGVFHNTMLLGTLIAFILYINNFFDPIRNLTMEYTQLQIAMASGSRIFELLNLKPDMTDVENPVRPQKFEGHIKFEKVSFHYEAGMEILKDIDLDIPSGLTTALVGPTGAGKTTLINLIARFFDVNGGRILIDGIDIRELDSINYRQNIGLVLQDPFLFQGTIRDNIAYGKLEASEEEIIRAARTVGAHEFISKMEKGYDSELEERGQNLSMGQRQLISFARALVANPSILLLDEATASIDSSSEHIIQNALKEITRGRTTIIIAHRLSTVQEADNIIVIDQGRIVEQGSHSELVAAGNLYARMYSVGS
ncbi:MAG TPA: ABC transporter ATP-binding protein [Dehalococcoidales bacterium]|nr:ABC transporter ATP-binding protein [Dehalococcoidales bacterium]